MILMCCQLQCWWNYPRNPHADGSLTVAAVAAAGLWPEYLGIWQNKPPKSGFKEARPGLRRGTKVRTERARVVKIIVKRRGHSPARRDGDSVVGLLELVAADVTGRDLFKNY